MGKTKIEYLDFSWNPIAMRCTPVSEGCAHCWHRAMANRLRANTSLHFDIRRAYAGEGPPVLIEKRLNEPLCRKTPTRFGVQFMGDLFHEDIPERWLRRIFKVMAAADRHTFLLLTKRPQRMLEFCQSQWYQGLRAYGLSNIRLGVSVENQATADERREYLRQAPAAVKFVSYEPALAPVDWSGWEFVDQIISGGESGPQARPSHPNWHRATRDFCQENSIAYFFKQWGGWMPIGDFDSRTGVYHYSWKHAEPYKHVVSIGLDGKVYNNDYPPRQGWHMARVGKKRAGRLLDGQLWEEYPNE